jgi:toxin ParE1/3/4
VAQSVIWSQESLDDLNSIAEYISRDSLYYAQQVVEHILERSEGLIDQPKIGRKVPELNDPNVRECFVYSNRLIYEINTDIQILAVIHGNRLLQSVERFQIEE